jgi:hypothetical protein
MSGKRLKAIIVAALLAFVLSIASPSPVAPTVVLAEECEATAGGCH